MAFSEVYVDPSINADSGTGTVGDPYGDLEYAVEQTTFDTVNGTRVNIKAGTDEVLAASLDVAMDNAVTTVAWAPAAGVPAVFQGYTTTAGDGGIGGISGGGSISICDNNKNYIRFIDLHLHNTGAAQILDMGAPCLVTRCDLENSSAAIAVDLSTYGRITQSYIHNCTPSSFLVGVGLAGTVKECFLETGQGYCIALTSAFAERNICVCSGTAIGIRMVSNSAAYNNSVYSSGGTGSGISVSAATGEVDILNNLIEGFSGSGGNGIDTAGSPVNVYGANSVYNCETAFVAPSDDPIAMGGNETLSVSPFTDAASNDLSPVDTGSVKEGHLPTIIGGGFVV